MACILTPDHLHFILFLLVKYCKELLPYFRKASLLASIGWELAAKEDGFLFAPSATHPSRPIANDTKAVPLLLSHLTRPTPATIGSGPESSSLSRNYPDDILAGRIIQIYSPNRQNVCTLRFVDPAQCASWFAAIHSTTCVLMSQAIIEANEILAEVLDCVPLRHMGWLFEKVSLPRNLD